MKLQDRRWGYSNQWLFIIRSPAIVARFGRPSLEIGYLMMPDRKIVAVSVIMGDLSFIDRRVAEGMFRGVNADYVFAFGNYSESIKDYEINVDYMKGAHPLRETFMVIDGLQKRMVSLAEKTDAPPFGVITTQSILWLYSHFMGRQLRKKQTAIVV